MIEVNDLLSRLQGVRGSGSQYSARCPAHDDSHNSLSVGLGQDGRILLNCHAGCQPQAIVAALGLELADLFPQPGPARSAPPARGKPQVVATYDFLDDAGNLIAQKLRRSDKSFTWRQPDGKGGWVYHRKGVPYRLYLRGTPNGAILLAEGEKDVDTLVGSLGYQAAACGMDGAGNGKWKQAYTAQLNGLRVAILQDHDPVGKAYARETAAALCEAGNRVQLLDLAKVWPEIPEHGDVSDLAAQMGPQQARALVDRLLKETPAYEPEPDPFLACFHTLDEFQEEEAAWLVPGWIPEGQITTMAADGGTGKTTAWVDLAAAVSSGRPCVLDPPGHIRKPQRVAFLTTEDSVRKKLLRKLRLAGANLHQILTPDFTTDRAGNLKGLKFGSPEMERFLRHFRPALCIFDPIQGFVPPEINMGSRNAMRDCIAPLVALGEECNVTSLLIAHTNKRKGASGRDRISDSADIWDISRSVIMMGYTEQPGVRYLSNEKNNYDALQQTVLFTVDQDGLLCREGTTWKRDREYQLAAVAATTPTRQGNCKEVICERLEQAGGSMPSAELEDQLVQDGFTIATIRRAKEALKGTGRLKYHQTGSKKEKVWHTQLVAPEPPQPVELPEDTPTPFDGPPLEGVQMSVEESLDPLPV